MGTLDLRSRQKAVIGVAGATRAASSGLLATALVVFVGREGSLFAVGMLATVFHFGTMLFAPLWGALGDLTGRRRGLLVGISAASTVVAFAFAAVDGVWTFVGLRGLYAVFVVGYGTLMLSLVGALGGTERRGRAIGFFKSATAAGNVAAKVLVGVFLLLLPPRYLFLLVGTLSLIATAALAGYRAAFALMGLVGVAAALLTARTMSEPDRPAPVPPERRTIETRPDLTRLPGAAPSSDD